MLATLNPRPPSKGKWVHEIKFDGYRAQLHKRDSGTKMFTRRGHDWSDKFRHIIRAAGELVTHGAILDGEVIVQTPEGHSDFAALESALSAKMAPTIWSSTPSTFSTWKCSICGAARCLIASACSTRSSKRSKGRSGTASTWKRTAEKCSRMPARWNWRAWSQNAPMESMNPAVATCGSRPPAATGRPSSGRHRGEAGEV